MIENSRAAARAPYVQVSDGFHITHFRNIVAAGLQARAKGMRFDAALVDADIMIRAVCSVCCREQVDLAPKTRTHPVTVAIAVTLFILIPAWVMWVNLR